MVAIAANLDKLRSLQRQGWRIESITTEYDALLWRSAVVLKLGQRELTLHSNDQDFARACHATKQFFDTSGNRMFRQVADVGRYYAELMPLTVGFEEEVRKAFERLCAGQIRLPFDPSKLIREFLLSKAWGASKFLPLKIQYFDILAAVYWLSKNSADAESNLYRAIPRLSDMPSV
jgi:hypothetical protein